MPDEGFLTTGEVREYLEVNLRTVYRLIKANKLPAVRVGRQWRFRKRDIDAWLAGQRSPDARVPAPPPEKRRPARPRILLADHQPQVREPLSRALALAEYDVEQVPDGQVAVDRLRLNAYDLLITELKLPGLDGISVIREARRLRPRMPIIIVTGFSTEATAIEAVNLGVSGYLTKPVRVPHVLAAAYRALGD